MSTKSFSLIASSILLMTLSVSCSKGDVGSTGDSFAGKSDYAGDTPGAGSGGSGNTQAGIVTAGEWCDLENWIFWSNLMLDQQSEYKDVTSYWQMNTSQRVAVKVCDAAGNPCCGVKVALSRDGENVWNAITDNRGRADCWLDFTKIPSSGEKADSGSTKADDSLVISLDGTPQESAPIVSPWTVAADKIVNEYVFTPQGSVSGSADIAFIVDATGSMGDEMEFLKQDLVDIINKVAASEAGLDIRTGTVFYRDEGDEYLTRHSGFTSDAQSTADFISEQHADGGGDYPEAVHDALVAGLQNLDWNGNARARLAFLLLDAPAHHTDEIIASLQASLNKYAAMGIRIIPIAASGVDKNTEFMLRFFAVSTGGSYVFITNDSGVGGDHIQATVGEYKIEQLNDLIVRLIKSYVD